MQPNNQFKSGQYRPTKETPFRWHFAGGQIVAREDVGWKLCFEIILTQCDISK